ncbi:subclass B1 metallo-beta-lactamase [Polaribacter sp. MSW13]|uniref:beta-lactamase n=1 Tax=Polaribacter marinus TaxID=2916838 RepID=A0A9X2ALP9_9FLAO|nr:subclass B1 metallo-beta-lactamase [Polaribacter marinus]MCI2228059.1 subclass B1 metallo-beta-lactamase [Polaribacter marinus]
MREALSLVAVLLSLISCTTKTNHQTIYKTDSLVIEQITPHIFKHVSYLQTDDFGYVPCNGMIYITDNKALVFDSPTTDEVSKELIKWIKTSKQSVINGIIVNHFHDDCLGGLKEFHKQNIASYANNRTINLARKDSITVPLYGFDKRLDLMLGSNKVITQFLGEGHTKDNIVSYVESENTLFGGCLIKSLKAKKGYLGNANISEWSSTVTKVKETFPKIKNIIPGHGKVGDAELLDYTIQLFKQ